MKITLVGPGIIFIPPTGWGAIESLIWDFNIELSKLGHTVQIVNTAIREEIIEQINAFEPDFVHVHYDLFIDIFDKIKCPKKAATSHFAYIEQLEKHGNYSSVFNSFIENKNFYIFCLSEGIKNTYKNAGIEDSRLKVLCNGSKEDLFVFKETPIFPNRSIYLARICERKRQYVYQNIEGLYFAGRINDRNFSLQNPRHLGEWSKNVLYENLTNYANLVLLSDGEADPLVTKEALMSGLGLVISESSTANLDLSKSFIDVVPNNKLNDIKYVENIIKNNREKSIPLRNEIRKYAVENFSWAKVTEKYINIINTL